MIKVRIKKLPQARTGYQVQGALVNDVPAMGGADYNAYIGKPKLKESKYITAVPREEANLEAEGGETVYGDLNGDGMPEHKIIKGPRHHSGGVPLNLPDDTFIYSDTRGMKIKDPEILEMFGKVGTKKAYTPASLAKQYDIQKYRVILENPESDHLDRKTAELMIKKFVIKLGCLALAQEAKKGFPQGIPAVAKPCMEAKGITEEAIGPDKNILQLKDQIKSQYKMEENSEETMESEEQSDNVAQAEELNQGQPVAQPAEQQQPSPEEMMMYGGYSPRRLRRAEQGMEQVPEEEMMQEPQQQGGNQMMEIVQEVGAALQEGAEPEEIVMSLLQNQLPPEVIMQIFVQLGASEQEAAGLIQQVLQQLQGGGQEQMMQGQPPMEGQPMSEEEAMMMQQQQMQQQVPQMAQYGMSIGGYDMPFYDASEYEEDLPEAEYGVAMGSGMSQNYQGRPKPIPGSGPMFPLPKASNGWIIKRSDYPAGAAGDTQYERAVYDANAEREELRKNKPNDARANEQIQVIDANNQTRNFKGFTRQAPTDFGSYNFGNTDLAKQAAAQYYLLEKEVGDPNSTVSKKLCQETTKVLGEEKHFRSKSKATTPSTNWTTRGYALPDCTKITQQYLAHQKRNLMFEAKAIDGALYLDSGRGFNKWEDYTVNGTSFQGVGSQIAAGIKVRDPRDPSGNTFITTKQDMVDAQKYLSTTYNGSNVNNIATKLGVPFETGTETRALQQATFHGYALMLNNMKAGLYDADTKYALRNFLGELQSGVGDEASMSYVFPKLTGNYMISPIDDFREPNQSYYGNTTMKHLSGAGIETMQFEDPNDPGGCQCDDPSKTATYGKKDPSTGKCNPELCKEASSAKCPCVIVDENGNQTTVEKIQNADGSCPCEEEKDIDIEGPPAEWWLQDTIKTTGAFGDLMGVKKYMPWAPAVELQKPRPTFLDPTRELAANAEQANIQTQGMAQFAGPQALSARSASVQGQAAKNAADVLSKYNNANVNIANQFELKGTDIANQESMLKQATAQRLYDQNTVANQQFDNSKLAMRNNLRNYYTNAITNKWQTDALNQMYPNYAVRPGVGGRMEFKPGNRQVTGQGSSSGFDWQKAKNECTQANPGADTRLIESCIKSKQIAAGGGKSSRTGANANIGMGMYGNQTTGKKKGGATNDNGYVYLDSWLPFLM